MKLVSNVSKQPRCHSLSTSEDAQNTFCRLLYFLRPCWTLVCGHRYAELLNVATLFVYSPPDDGILRVYDLSTFKVVKAVRNLENEVSSIICMKRPGSDLRDAWIACGTKASESDSFMHHVANL